MQQGRVVITGLGLVAPNGTGIPAFWHSLLAGESGIAEITLFDASNHPIRIAGEVKDFDLTRYTNGRLNPRRLGRHTQLAIAAALLALKDARIELGTLNHEGPVPICLGVSTSAIDLVEQGMERMTSRGPERVSPFVLTAGLPHASTYTLAQTLGIHAQPLTISSACQSGMDALVNAFQAIRSGRADLAVAGGTDAPITPLTVASFCASGLVPPHTGDPRKASRPFDRSRTGGIMAEGAGVLILESLEHALARGAGPYLEITGCASMADPVGSESGSGLAPTMQMALANAGRLPQDIDYICAHGPSDPLIDRVETDMIKQIFGRRAYRIPVSSIKAVTGNPLAAQGPLQVAACALATREQRVPPTANYEHPDPQCDLDYVPGAPRQAALRRMLVNVHGLGGGNSSMILEACPPA